MLLYLFLIIFSLFVVIALSDWFSREARLMRKIPGPKAWPIIGNIMSVRPSRLPHEWDNGKNPLFLSRWRDYGHLYQIHALNMRMVLITNPEDAEKIYSSLQHTTKSDFYKFTSAWLGEGLPLSKGAKWQQRRKMLLKTFDYNILKKFIVTFNEETEVFLKKIEEETANEKTNLLDLVCPLVLRILYETTTGISFRQDQDAYTKYLNSIFTLTECIASRFFRIWLHNDFLFNLSGIAKRYYSELENFQAFTNKVINEKRELLKKTNFVPTDHNSNSYEINKKLPLLDFLLEKEKSGIIDNEDIKEELNSFMFAGFDTTKTTLSLFLMTIANESAAQDKIYEEQQRIFGDSQRPSTIEDLNEMKYLECCIKEALRLYPSTPLVSRVILEDIVLGGYTVPAGTDIMILTNDLQRRPDLYPDPERFDPDRFLPENSRDRHPYSYMPFSAGPRNCIGQKYVMLELKTVLSGLLRKFRVEPVTRHSEIIFLFDINLRTKEPLYARFRLRN